METVSLSMILAVMLCYCSAIVPLLLKYHNITRNIINIEIVSIRSLNEISLVKTQSRYLILSSQGAQLNFIIIVILSLDSSRLYSNLDWLSFVTDLCSCFLLSVLPEQMVSEKGQVGLPFV